MNNYLNTSCLNNVPRTAIVALINEEDKKAYVFVSRNAPIRLIEISQQLQDNNFKIRELCKDFNKLQIRVLETSENYDLLRILANNHQISLQEQGYCLYKFNRYKQIFPTIEATYDLDGNIAIMVFLSTNSRNKDFVGIFESFDEAQEFVEHLKKPYTPITAYNKRTKRHIELMEERIETLIHVRM